MLVPLVTRAKPAKVTACVNMSVKRPVANCATGCLSHTLFVWTITVQIAIEPFTLALNSARAFSCRK